MAKKKAKSKSAVRAQSGQRAGLAKKKAAKKRKTGLRAQDGTAAGRIRKTGIIENPGKKKSIKKKPLLKRSQESGRVVEPAEDKLTVSVSATVFS
jgi:hypothetical protein